MNDFVRYVGSAAIALILMSIPGLLVASFALEWPGFLKALLCGATTGEGVMIMCLIYERSEDA